MAKRVYQVAVILMNIGYGALSVKCKGSRADVLPGRTIVSDGNGPGWQSIFEEETRRVFGQSIHPRLVSSACQLADDSTDQYIARVICSFEGDPKVTNLELFEPETYYLHEGLWQLGERLLAGDII